MAFSTLQPHASCLWMCPQIPASQGCFWCAQLPHSQKSLLLSIGRSTSALFCAETRLSSGTAVGSLTQLGPGNPSPAFSQGSQLLGAAMHLTGKHTEHQTGLKGKQKTQPFVLILFIVSHPLPP